MVPVVVISSKQEGDRMSALKTFMRMLKDMLNQINVADVKKIRFIFNKYVNREDEGHSFTMEQKEDCARELYGRLCEARHSLT